MRRILFVFVIMLMLPASAVAKSHHHRHHKRKLDLPPVNVSKPVVSGDTTVGSTLSTTLGTWRNKPTRYSVYWLRCSAPTSGCVTVDTGRTHVLGSEAVGMYFRSKVVAHNHDGSTAAFSNSVGPVQGTPPPPPGGLTIAVTTTSASVTEAQIAAALPTMQNDINASLTSWSVPEVTLVTSGPADYTANIQDSLLCGSSCAGYHDYKENGCGAQPCAFVLAYSGWQVALDHELKEMIVDPKPDTLQDMTTIQAPAPAVGITYNVYWLVEVCDPAEVDYSYSIGGVQLADPVTRDWYLPGTPGPFDYQSIFNAHQQTVPDGLAFFYDPVANTWYEYNSTVGTAFGKGSAKKLPGKPRFLSSASWT